MSLSDRFFQAVLDDPEDSTLRLIYADWLEEAGDPRGEFIRVQVELEQTPHADLRWRTLKNRETELLDEYLAEWLGPSARRVWKGFGEAQYQPFFAERGSCRLHRGFRETARMRAKTFTAHADEIFRTLPLRELHLFLDLDRGTLNRELDDLAGCGKLSNIRDLILEYPSYQGNPEPDSQQALESLLNTPALGQLRRLKFLCGFDPRQIAEPMVRSDRLANLETLEVCQFEGSAEIQRMLGSGDSDGARDRPARRDGIAVLAQAENLPSLRNLVIAEHRLDDASFEPIFHAPWFGQLTSLDITGNSLSDDMILRLAASPICSQLKTLRISRAESQQDRGHMQTGGCRALGEADFSQLEILELRRQNIGSRKIRQILKSRTLKNLEVLDLSGNPLKDAGVSAIANCKSLGNLRVLKVQSCSITAEGLSALANSPYLGKLEQLFVGGNSLDLGGIEDLLDSPMIENLRRLSFADCPQFAQGVFARLKSAKAVENLAELDLSGQRMNQTCVKQLIDSASLDELAHLSWFQSPLAKRNHDAESLLHARWPGRCRV